MKKHEISLELSITKLKVSILELEIKKIKKIIGIKDFSDLSIDDFDLWIEQNCEPNSREGYNYNGNTYTKHKLFEIYKKGLK